MIRFLLIFVLFFNIYTPVFLINKGGKEIQDKSSSYYKRLTDSLSLVYKETEVPKIADDMIQANIEKNKSGEEVSVTDLFSSKYRTAFISALIGNAAQQLCGINFLVFYTYNFFNKISDDGNTMNLVLAVMNILGGFIGVPLIEKMGRRFNLVVATFF